MSITLKSSTAQCETFTRQNGQLCSQVKALKEVIEVHKDLLNIRGMETDQLKVFAHLIQFLIFFHKYLVCGDDFYLPR